MYNMHLCIIHTSNLSLRNSEQKTHLLYTVFRAKAKISSLKINFLQKQEFEKTNYKQTYSSGYFSVGAIEKGAFGSTSTIVANFTNLRTPSDFLTSIEHQHMNLSSCETTPQLPTHLPL